ncbi:hypothetical protein GCM10010472_60550 [Pseudonocardia halophobica]|uniref:Uncharacterized protein n=1 Tax=Pseudonocardia halophobica TaxID=29401 RepID=A0A9W6P1B5_9PSEU|nr:hypothetical protein GCM10017577_71450 [Pseudonocardia halophobica]
MITVCMSATTIPEKARTGTSAPGRARSGWRGVTGLPGRYFNHVFDGESHDGARRDQSEQSLNHSVDSVVR